MDLKKDFADKIEENQLIIHKIASIYFTRKEDREDFFQDVLVNAWRSFPNFEYRSKFSTWLYKVALNTALMKLRKRSRVPKTVNIDEINTEFTEEKDSYEDNARMLYTAIKSLEELDRSIVILYLDKLSYREISEITGLSETNVGVKINRIKTKLKNIIDGNK
jgi:RNA polymerase sigma-70 factor (ECF subfamily)